MLKFVSGNGGRRINTAQRIGMRREHSKKERPSLHNKYKSRLSTSLKQGRLPALHQYLKPIFFAIPGTATKSK